jgi:integrase
MGRKSPFILPHLTQRRESSGYAYCRNIPSDVRSAISGEVHCPWSGETRALAGNTVVKLSLNTTDLATAKQRWNQVHAQIELIVGAATRRLRATRRNTARKPLVRVPGLTDQQIMTLSARVERDILLKHEEGVIDPNKRFERYGYLLSSEDTPDFPQSRQLRNIEFWHHHREAELVKQLYRDGDLEFFNGPIKLSAKNGLVEDSDAVGPHERIFVVPDEVSRVLAENGIELPPDHPDRRKIAMALMAAMQRGNEAVMKRLEGNAAVQTPPDPGPVVPQDIAEKRSEILISDAFKIWTEQNGRRERTIADYRTQIQRFIAIHGDLEVRSITRQHVGIFRDQMRRFPKSVPAAMASLNVHELIAWAERTSAERLSTSTVNDKAIGALSAVFRVLRKQTIVDSNPCLDMKLDVPDEQRNERDPYSADDVNRLLRSRLYAPPVKIPRAAGAHAGQWLPLLGLLTGARLEELGQLSLADIKVEDGTHYLDMMIIFDERGEKIRRKTASSRRKIPIHPMLVECGFLRYVDTMRTNGQSRLFPELTPYRGRYTYRWSKWWGRWARQHVSHSEGKCFHSFRHLFADALRSTGCADSIVERLLGRRLINL